MSTPGEGQREARIAKCASEIVSYCVESLSAYSEGRDPRGLSEVMLGDRKVVAALIEQHGFIHNAGASVTEPAKEEGWTPLDPHQAKAFPGLVAIMAKLEKRLCDGRVWDADFHELSKRVRFLADQALGVIPANVRAGADVEGPSEPEDPIVWPMGGVMQRASRLFGHEAPEVSGVASTDESSPGSVRSGPGVPGGAFASMEPLEAAVRAFLAKYDEVEPHIIGVFQVAQLHVGPYRGPSYEHELKALRAALSVPTADEVKAERIMTLADEIVERLEIGRDHALDMLHERFDRIDLALSVSTSAPK